MSPSLPRLAQPLLLLLALLGLAFAAPGTASAAPAPGAATIDAGADHTCAVKTDGSVACWGSNGAGQLGAGLPEDEYSAPPQPVRGIGDATPLGRASSLSAGTSHTCAVLADGRVACWGSNASGQLGSGGGGTTTPIAVPGITDAVAVASGGRHSCALRTGGAVSCWGARNEGQLGDNSVSASPSGPVSVSGLANATSITAGDDHTCVVRRPGTVACWGSNERGQLGAGLTGSGKRAPLPITLPGITDTLTLSAGSAHTCAARTDGTVRCWGDGRRGQLGNGASGGDTLSVTPVAVDLPSAATALTAGGDHVCVVAAGNVRCWGDGAFGELGNGQSGSGYLSATPVLVTGFTAATTVAAGDTHSCALTVSGAASCWGATERGQTGKTTQAWSTTPVAVPGSGFSALSAGITMSCGATGGAVSCWGSIAEGDGDPPAYTWRSPVPETVAGISDATALVSGLTHSCGLRSSGQVKCWGSSLHGQLGDGAAQGVSAAAVDVLHPTDDTEVLGDVTQLSSGFLHTCAVRANGTVVCWGFGIAGQLGTGNFSDAARPAQVRFLNDATSVASGMVHSCVLQAGGSVSCWGSNDSGQLGDNSDIEALPRPNVGPVTGLSDATALSAGAAHTCALRSGGAVSCWGGNDARQVGNGSSAATVTTPAAVVGLPPVVAISAGGQTTCGLGASGDVWCWGGNAFGQLGGPVTDEGTAPRRIPALQGADTLAVGNGHVCAIDGTSVRCLGDGTQGQLGDGLLPTAAGPQQPTAASVRGADGILLPTAPSQPIPDPVPTPEPTPQPTPDPGPGDAPPADNGAPADPTAEDPTPAKLPTVSAAKQVKLAQAKKQLRFRVLGGKPGSAYNGVLKVGNKGGKAAGKLDATGSALITLKLPKAQLKQVRKGTKLTLAINVVTTDGNTVKLTRVITVK